MESLGHVRRHCDQKKLHKCCVHFVFYMESCVVTFVERSTEKLSIDCPGEYQRYWKSWGMRAWLQGKTDITLLYTIFLQSDAMATKFFAVCLSVATIWGQRLFHSELRSLQLPYSRKLLREKTFMNWWKIWFLQRKLPQIAHFCHSKGHHTSKFCGENFRK